MASLNSLYGEKDRYIRLRNDVNSILSKISEAISTLDEAVANINYSYNIDDMPADNFKIKKECENLNNEKSKLFSIINSIDVEIRRLDSEIVSETERLKREAEEMARKLSSKIY